MHLVVLVIHLLLAVALIGTILLQRSEGGGMGLGGAGNMGAPVPRSQADGLSKTTGWLAAAFIVTSLTLAILAGGHGRTTSLIDELATPIATESAPAAPAEPAPAPAPSVPVTE